MKQSGRPPDCSPLPPLAGPGLARPGIPACWAGLGWQAGWHRLWQRQMERGGGLTPGPPGNGWDCLFVGALPLPPPPTSRLWEHGWGKGWGKKQHFRASVSTSSCSLWLSSPANGMHCLLPAWLWQKLRCVCVGGRGGGREGHDVRGRREGKKLEGDIPERSKGRPGNRPDGSYSFHHHVLSKDFLWIRPH